MSRTPMEIVVLGLSITSEWGNHHAAEYRRLLMELSNRGHRITFLERDLPWFAAERDLPEPEGAQVVLYGSLEELRDRFSGMVREADAVIVGSRIPEGTAVAEWVLNIARGVRAFYDLDTSLTLAATASDICDYLTPELIPRFDLYLSISGGNALEILENDFGSAQALPLYPSVDPKVFRPLEIKKLFDLGYVGSFAADRQLMLERTMIEPARQWREGRFAVAGPRYPDDILWPENLTRIEDLPPSDHPRFYNMLRFSLNLQRNQQTRIGICPNVRLLEAAACGIPIISDYWPGLDTFFKPGLEILISDSPELTLLYLRQITEDCRQELGMRARRRILAQHTAEHRAEQLELYLRQVRKGDLIPGGPLLA